VEYAWLIRVKFLRQEFPMRMRKSLKQKLMLTGAAMALTVLGSSAAVADVMLPTPHCGLGASNNCLIFNQFTVYSLALLNFQAGAGPIKPGDPYYVKSNGSAIAADIVIGSSDANAINNQDLPSIAGRVDNAYNTPNNSGSTVMTNFLMIPPDSAASFAGDNIAQGQTKVNNQTTPVAGAPTGVANGTMPLWDIQTSALISYLNGSALTFFFNLNQINSDSTYLAQGQDMLATLEVIFTNSLTGASTKFYLNGDSCGGVPGSCVPGVQSYAQSAANQNDILESSSDLWAYVHGQICVSPAGAVVSFSACDPSDHTDTTVNQNLGANTAAFALFSQGAQDALNSGKYDIMSVDLRMAAEDNGFEQLFIEGSNLAITRAPEPASIAIAGAGLGVMGLGMIWRRRRAARK
jgi:hypothetical protein